MPEEQYTRDAVHGWVHGNHPDATPVQHEALQEMLIRNKGAFAYAVTDLPLYSGDGGPQTIPLTHNNPIFETKRRHSQLDEQTQDEKCSELREAGFIEKASIHNPYASNCHMPSKKDSEGNHTERRFTVDFRMINESTETNTYNLPTLEATKFPFAPTTRLN